MLIDAITLDLFLATASFLSRDSLALTLSVCREWHATLDAHAHLWAALFKRFAAGQLYVPASLTRLARGPAVLVGELWMERSWLVMVLNYVEEEGRRKKEEGRRKKEKGHSPTYGIVSTRSLVPPCVIRISITASTVDKSASYAPAPDTAHTSSSSPSSPYPPLLPRHEAAHHHHHHHHHH